MRTVRFLCTLLLAVMLIPDVVMAQVCPAAGHFGNGSFAFASSKNTTQGDLFDFVGAGVCTYNKFGATEPTACIFTQSPSFVGLSAIWGAPPATPSLNGCSFVCGGVTCQVRASDGLPVELMEFAVDEEDSEK